MCRRSTHFPPRIPTTAFGLIPLEGALKRVPRLPGPNPRRTGLTVARLRPRKVPRNLVRATERLVTRLVSPPLVLNGMVGAVVVLVGTGLIEAKVTLRTLVMETTLPSNPRTVKRSEVLPLCPVWRCRPLTLVKVSKQELPSLPSRPLPLTTRAPIDLKALGLVEFLVIGALAYDEQLCRSASKVVVQCATLPLPGFSCSTVRIP